MNLRIRITLSLTTTLFLCAFLFGCGKGGTSNSNPRLQNALDKLAAAGSPEQRFLALGDAARQSFAVGKIGDAQKFAQEILDLLATYQANPQSGNAAHDAHQVLGRVAVRDGRLGEAKQHLLQSVRTPGPRQVDYGPSMSLAKDLLEKGEQQAVLNYLELCAKFWSRNRLEEWGRQVKEGKIPDFPANLLD